MSEVLADLLETVEDIVVAVASKEVDPADIADALVVALRAISQIPLQRSPEGLRKAARRHSSKAVRLRRRGHDKAAERHERKAKELLEKAEEG